ncbi:MAG: hypothetical protein R3F43_29250 [bacterium]
MADRLGALGVLLDGLLLEQQLAAPADTPPRRPWPRPRRRSRPLLAGPGAAAADPEGPASAVGPRPGSARIRPGGAPDGGALRSQAGAASRAAAPGERPGGRPAAPPPRVTITPQTRFFGGVELGLRWRTPALLVPQAGVIGG